MISYYILIVILFYIFIEDVTYLGISWPVFPLLLFVSAIYSIHKYTLFKEVIGIQITNTVIYLIQLFLLFIYISIKEKRITNITKNHFGWGDILFSICIASLFSTYDYILFHLFSTFFSITIWYVLFKLKIYKSNRIPYAGLQALYILLIELLSIKIKSLNAYTIYSFKL